MSGFVYSSRRGRHRDATKICFGNFIKEHPALKTILAIDLGKSKSVFCKMDTIELKPRFSTGGAHRTPMCRGEVDGRRAKTVPNIIAPGAFNFP